MFTSSTLIYFFVETPLHAGSGRGLGAVDLPIQRERATGYPLVQASGIKGKLRAEAYRIYEPFLSKFSEYLPKAEEKVRAEMKDKKDVKEQDIKRLARDRARHWAASEVGLESVFGPDAEGMKDENSQHAGAISPGDARLLLLPVRSLMGVFAWTTSVNALARFARDATAAGIARDWSVNPLAKDVAYVAPGSQVASGDKMILEEFSYKPEPNELVQHIGAWLAANALPPGGEYEYWRTRLPLSLAILPEDDFRDFALYATEVVTRVKINSDSKTVDKEHGALWTEESLPADTLLYAPLFAADPRKKANGIETGAHVLQFVHDLNLERVQLGGDETVGRGLVALRIGR